ncbi:MAG: PAS domain S-box protein [Pirellulales bacterium]|nr:PAS domain S-box protein [Pirellulales bacterium]
MNTVSPAKPRLLVVHDRPEMRTHIRQLAGAELALEEAADARQALAAATSRPADLILFEADLLAHDRCRALHNLRADARTAKTPVIVLAGPETEPARRTALAAGADDFLQLPFDAVDLQARLGVHLRMQDARRQIALELRQPQEELREALASFGAGAFRWEIRTGALEWDEALDRLLGLPPGQTIGSLESLLSKIHPADRQRAADRYRKCAAGGGKLELEHRVGATGEDARWLYVRGQVFTDEQNRPSYVTGACFDVTLRKRTELRRQFDGELEGALRLRAEPADLGADAVKLLGDYLEADRAALGLVEADENVFQVTCDYCREPPRIAGQHRIDQFGREALRVLRSNQPLVIHRLDGHEPPPETYLAYRQLQIQSAVWAPVHEGGKLVAVLGVFQSTPRQWADEDVELVRRVAQRIWESIQRLRMERDLQDSEARFRQLADLVPLVVWQARPDGAVDYYNQRWQQLTGMPGGVVGDPGWEPFLHPDDLQQVRRDWYKAVKAGEPFVSEHRLKDAATGEYRWFMARAVPVRDASGKVVRWFGVCTDVHEFKLVEQALRANEQRLEAIFEAAPECVKIVGRDGTVLQMNRSGLDILEAGSKEEVCGGPILEFIAPEHRQTWLENHEAVCLGENRRWEFELLTRLGNRRWMEAHAVPVVLPGGERAHLAVARDITSRKRSEAEREQLLQAERNARAEAEQLGRVKDEFLGTLSHELRTPLNAVLGYATLMQMADQSAAEREEAITTIERNARLLAKLVDDLLDMNRILSGKIRLDVQTISLPDIVHAAIDTVRPSAAAKGVELLVDLDPAAGQIRGDAERIHQVMWNLLSNAVRFNRPGGWARVSVTPVAGHIQLAVADSGEGIAAHFLPHVFDRFRQADSTTTRKHGGLGLGLSIVRHLVELHGGVVHAASEGVGRGATFTVLLPSSPPAEAGGEPSPQSSLGAVGPSSGWPADLAGVAVLAVDDDPDSCRMVKRVLEECRATVATVASARAALELLQERAFNVLISDIGMPIEDGYDLMRTVRSLGGTTRAVQSVALTAFARPEDRRRASLAGFQAYVTKPVDAGELIAVVAQLVGRSIRPAYEPNR